MAYEVKFGDLVLDGIESFDSDLASRAEAESFPRRHGAIVQAIAFLRERHVRLSGKVVKDTEAALDTYLDDLAQRLVELGQDKLFKKSTDNRYLNAIMQRIRLQDLASEAPALSRRFEIEFLVDDPFWYSTTEQASALQTVVASPHAFSVTNNGRAETPPRIEIKAASGNATSVKLSNTTVGLFVEFTGTILNGNTLVIDHKELNVENGGADGLNDLGSGASFWPLIRGLNNLEYTGPTGVEITVYWTERWAS